MKLPTFPRSAALARGGTSGFLQTDAMVAAALTGRAVGLVAPRAPPARRAGGRPTARARTPAPTVLPRRHAARRTPRTHVARTHAAPPAQRRLGAVPARALARTRPVSRQRVPRHAVPTPTAAVARPVASLLSLDPVGALARALHLGGPPLERAVRAPGALAPPVLGLRTRDDGLN